MRVPVNIEYKKTVYFKLKKSSEAHVSTYFGIPSDFHILVSYCISIGLDFRHSPPTSLDHIFLSPIIGTVYVGSSPSPATVWRAGAHKGSNCFNF